MTFIHFVFYFFPPIKIYIFQLTKYKTSPNPMFWTRTISHLPFYIWSRGEACIK